MKNHLVASAVALALLPAYASAEDAAVTLPALTVDASSTGGSLTQADVDTQREDLNRTAGAVSFVDSEQFKTVYANTLRDVLKNTPGVFAQNRYGQEMRVSVRGSGLSRGFHTRGIEILQDG
ncbi:MAG TPA: TonB-dependent receptor plug domain-containing protein, partial [Alphaproteobacteria bacterium]|nr:TonB-dependent receptor plug domain-containing protein [Alphaproteobacteria bacterium]